MKKQLLIIIITLLGTQCFSQIYFEQGYFIDNSDQKTICLIKNIDWNHNPTEFSYKLSKESEIKLATIDSIKEFAIDNNSKYVRSTVQIDRSSENVNKLSIHKDPLFTEEQLFLKVLTEGYATLYQYKERSLNKFFYKKDYTDIQQLVYKSYKMDNNKIGENIKYKQQLWMDLRCSNIEMTEVNDLAYNKNDLVDFFNSYGECKNIKQKTFNPEKDLFNLTIRPRLNISSLTLESNNSTFDDIAFNNQVGYGVGIETEFILPFNSNKWAIAIEASYESFKSKTNTNSNPTYVYGGEIYASEIEVEANYRYVQFPLSLRHYIFINEQSKIFINASLIYEIVSESSSVQFNASTENFIIKSIPPDYEPVEQVKPGVLQPVDIEAKFKSAIGIGYKIYDKCSLEMRYQFSNDIITPVAVWNSDYNTLSFILGYSFF